MDGARRIERIRKRVGFKIKLNRIEVGRSEGFGNLAPL